MVCGSASRFLHHPNHHVGPCKKIEDDGPSSHEAAEEDECHLHACQEDQPRSHSCSPRTGRRTGRTGRVMQQQQRGKRRHGDTADPFFLQTSRQDVFRSRAKRSRAGLRVMPELNHAAVGVVSAQLSARFTVDWRLALRGHPLSRPSLAGRISDGAVSALASLGPLDADAEGASR